MARRLFVSLVALVLIGAGAWFLDRSKKAEEGKPAKDAPPQLLKVQDDQVQRLEIRKQGAEPVVLESDKGQKWRITAPQPLPAEQPDVSAYLSTLKGVLWDRLIEDKATDLGGYGLATPSLEVTVTGTDGKSQKLLLGDVTPTGGAVFAKLGSDDRVFTLTDSTKTNLDKSANDLRDKRLLTFDSDKLSKLEVSTATESVELAKGAQKDWQIVKPKPYRADGFQVEELIGKLKQAKMDLTASDEDVKKTADAFAHTQKAATVKVTDSTGTQVLEVHKNPVAKLYYAKSSVVPGIYKIATDAGEGLEKGLNDLRNKKLFEFGFNEPSKVEVNDSGKTYSFAKAGDKWMSNGKQMDATSFQMLVDKLRDLIAIKFVDKPVTTPTIDLTVVSGEGKRTEKVQIGKVGDSFLAKREGDANTYELDGKVVDELQKAAGDVKPATAGAGSGAKK